MVVKVLQDIFELMADCLNILVCAVMQGMDLGMDRLNDNIPGLSTFWKIMLALGIAVVFFCIIAEAFRLVLSPFSGQARGSGAGAIIRCLIAGILVVFVFSFSMKVLESAVQPFYTMIVNWSREEVAGSSAENYRGSTLGELMEDGKTPQDIIDEYETYKARAEDATNGYVKSYWEGEMAKLESSYKAALAYVNGDESVVDQWDMKRALTNQINSVLGEAGNTAAIGLVSIREGTAILFALAVVIVMLVRFVQLILSLLMRYITFGVAIYMSPLCMGFVASPATAEIPKMWLKTVVSQIILFMTTVWGMSVMYKSLTVYPENMTAFDLIIKLAFIFVFGKLILKMDELLNRLGFNTMPTTDNARSGLYGAAMLGMMAFRTFRGGGSGGKVEKTAGVQATKPVTATSDGKIALVGSKGGTQISGKAYQRLMKNPQNQAIESVNESMKSKTQVSNSQMERAFDLKGNSGGKAQFVEGANSVPDKKYDAINSRVEVQGANGGSKEQGLYVSLNESGVYQKNPDGSYVGDERKYVEHDDFSFTGEYVNLGNGVRGYYTEPKTVEQNRTRDPARTVSPPSKTSKR